MKVALAVVVFVGLLSSAAARVGEEKPLRSPQEADGEVVVDELQDESSTVEAVEEEELMDYVVGFKQPKVDSLGSSMTQQEMVQFAMSSAFTTLSGPFKIHTMIPRFASAGVMLSARTIEELENNDMVEYIEPNGFVYPNAEKVPYGIQMVLGKSPPPNFSGPAVGCDDASSFKVALLDGGLDVTHHDFDYCGVDANGKAKSGKLTRCIGERFFEVDGATEDQHWYNSKNVHGTHVAGTIAGSALNGDGVRGIVGDEKVCLVVARVFDDEGAGATYSAVAASIAWALENNAKVINMSFGTATASNTIKHAVDSAAQQGTILVSSSGNGAHVGNELNYPAAFGNTVSVAAVDSDKQWAFFSTYNSYVDLAAPGVDIISSIPGNSGTSSGPKSGTSMAAPHVAGAATLIWRSCPDCNREEVIGCLIDTVEPLNCEADKCGAGLLQVDDAYRCMISHNCCLAQMQAIFSVPNVPLEATADASEADDGSNVDAYQGTCAAQWGECFSADDCCSNQCLIMWNQPGGLCR